MFSFTFEMLQRSEHSRLPSSELNLVYKITTTTKTTIILIATITLRHSTWLKWKPQHDKRQRIRRRRRTGEKKRATPFVVWSSVSSSSSYWANFYFRCRKFSSKFWINIFFGFRLDDLLRGSINSHQCEDLLCIANLFLAF